MKRLLTLLAAGLLGSSVWATSVKPINPIAGAKTIEISIVIGDAIRIDDPTAEALFGTNSMRADAFKAALTKTLTEFLGRHKIGVRSGSDRGITLSFYGGRSPSRDCEGSVVFLLEVGAASLSGSEHGLESSWARGVLGTARDGELEAVLTASALKVLDDLVPE